MVCRKPGMESWSLWNPSRSRKAFEVSNPGVDIRLNNASSLSWPSNVCPAIFFPALWTSPVYRLRTDAGVCPAVVHQNF